MRFAALRAAEAGMDIYDFTEEDRGEDEDDDDDAEVPPGVYRNTGHVRAMSALCQKYPLEAAAIAVFDLWIGNEDRALNFKGQIRGEERGVIFALDQGSSLLACRSTIDNSLAELSDPTYPSFHPFQKLVNGVIVFFLQIDTLTQKNSSRDKHLQNRLSRTRCAFGAD